MKKVKVKPIISSAVFLALIVGLNIIGKYFQETIISLFSYPAAILTSMFLGVPLIKSDALTYTLLYSNTSINIIESCSGYNFWTICFSFFAYQILNKSSFKRAAKRLILLLPFSYIITIIINSIRIIASSYIRILGAAHVPEKYADVIHLWAGVIIFLSALITMHILFQRRFSHEA